MIIGIYRNDALISRSLSLQYGRFSVSI